MVRMTSEMLSRSDTAGPRRIDWSSVGSMIGVCGAAIGFAVVSVLSGTIGSLWVQVLGLFAVSAALGLLMLVAFRLAPAGVRGLVLAGGVLTLIGVLMLVISQWIVPAAGEASEGGSGVSVAAAPEWASIAIAGLGAMLLAAATARLGLWRRD